MVINAKESNPLFNFSQESKGVVCSIENDCNAHASGEHSVVVSTGNENEIVLTSVNGVAATTGDHNKINMYSGRSVGVATGAGNRLIVSKNSLGVAYGPDCIALGDIGSHIVLTEWENGEIINMVMITIDCDKYRSYVWYKLVNGEVVEVPDDEDI